MERTTGLKLVETADCSAAFQLLSDKDEDKINIRPGKQARSHPLTRITFCDQWEEDPDTVFALTRSDKFGETVMLTRCLPRRRVRTTATALASHSRLLPSFRCHPPGGPGSTAEVSRSGRRPPRRSRAPPGRVRRLHAATTIPRQRGGAGGEPRLGTRDEASAAGGPPQPGDFCGGLTLDPPPPIGARPGERFCFARRVPRPSGPTLRRQP